MRLYGAGDGCHADTIACCHHLQCPLLSGGLVVGGGGGYVGGGGGGEEGGEGGRGEGGEGGE